MRSPPLPWSPPIDTHTHTHTHTARKPCRVPGANHPKPIARPMRPREILRFLRFVTWPGGVGGCWIWTGHKDKKGYGQFKWLRRSWWAHRLSYRTFVGKIPEGMTINHKRQPCGNPSCVNPAHLELMTLAENTTERNDYHSASKCDDADFIPD